MAKLCSNRGEPDAVKAASPVLRGVVGKVPVRTGNSLAAYPTHLGKDPEMRVRRAA